MSETSVEMLFDEFATRYARGERPDVREYLERAGDEREAVSQLIDRYLQAVPARVPSEEEIVLMQARLEQEPPLVLLRLRRRLSRQAIVDALVDKLGLASEKRDKVAGYYHELEVGTLDPNPVSSSVWTALADVLQANVRALAGLRPEPPPVWAYVAYRRRPTETPRYLASWSEGAADEDVSRPTRAQPSEQDEVDKLFTGKV